MPVWLSEHRTGGVSSPLGGRFLGGSRSVVGMARCLLSVGDRDIPVWRHLGGMYVIEYICVAILCDVVDRDAPSREHVGPQR